MHKSFMFHRTAYFPSIISHRISTIFKIINYFSTEFNGPLSNPPKT